MVKASPFGFPGSYYGVAETNTSAEFAIFADLQTFLSAQATCVAYGSNLAAASSQDDFNAISGLINDVWSSNSNVSTMYKTAYSASTKPPFVGLNTTSPPLQTCAWIGEHIHACPPLHHQSTNGDGEPHAGLMNFMHAMTGLTNLKPPAALVGLATSEYDNIAGISFINGVQTAPFWTNIRTQWSSGGSGAPSGWGLYGKAASSASMGPLAQSGESYATCTMVCVDSSSGALFTTITEYYAECSSVALPYVCQVGSPSNTGSIFKSPVPGSPETFKSTKEGEASSKESAAASHEHGRRRLSSSSDAVESSASRRVAAANLHDQPAPEEESFRAQAERLAASVTIPLPSGPARQSGQGRGLLSDGASSRRWLGEGESTVTSAWPPTGTLFPTTTSAGNATCFPYGMYSLCTFPASAKLTQPDWMYTCWAAGLEPLAIYSYSQLYMLTWGSTIYSLPVGKLGFIYTQVCQMIDA